MFVAATPPILTTPAAIVVARNYAFGLALAQKAQGKATAAQVKTFYRWMVTHPPKTARVTCRTVKVWRVTWTGIDPIFVGRAGVKRGCR